MKIKVGGNVQSGVAVLQIIYRKILQTTSDSFKNKIFIKTFICKISKRGSLTVRLFFVLTLLFTCFSQFRTTFNLKADILGTSKCKGLFEPRQIFDVNIWCD